MRMTDDEFEEIKARHDRQEASSDDWDGSDGWDYSHACEMHEDRAALIAEFERLRAVAAVAEKIKQAREERYERARAMQALAAEARRTGKSQAHRIPQQPHVFSLGDLVDELVEALG